MTFEARNYRQALRGALPDPNGVARHDPNFGLGQEPELPKSDIFDPLSIAESRGGIVSKLEEHKSKDLSYYRLDDAHYQQILQAGRQLYYDASTSPLIQNDSVRRFIAANPDLAHHFIDPRTLEITGGASLRAIEKTQQYIERQLSRLESGSLTERERTRVERYVENAERRIERFASSAEKLQLLKMNQLTVLVDRGELSNKDIGQESFVKTASFMNSTGLALAIGGGVRDRHVAEMRKIGEEHQLAHQRHADWLKARSIASAQALDEARAYSGGNQRPSPHTVARLGRGNGADLLASNFSPIEPTSINYLSPQEFFYYRDRVEKKGIGEVQAAGALKPFLFAYASVASKAEKERLPSYEWSTAAVGPHLDGYHKGVLLLAEKFKLHDDPAVGQERLRQLHRAVSESPGSFGMSPQEMAAVFTFDEKHIPGKNVKERTADLARAINGRFDEIRRQANVGAAEIPEVRPQPRVTASPAPTVELNVPAPSSQAAILPSRFEASVPILAQADSPYKNIFSHARESGYEVRLTSLGQGAEGSFSIVRNGEVVGTFLLDVREREKRLATILSGLLGHFPQS